ncbi:MAG: iron-sulfur cluster insertion protein ErpA [Actinobacteria bacterium]|nr:iron-sulfur cluster insertion protein ErpA [Actinomycetota bacterium]
MTTPTQISLGGVRTKAPDTIVVSDVAAAKVAELLAAEDDKSLVLRVAVRPGGCSGFSYEMFFDNEIAEDDTVEEFKGVKVAVDPASAPHLKGATLDYKDALQGGGFSINNPNAERTCGCGQSFS